MNPQESPNKSNWLYKYLFWILLMVSVMIVAGYFIETRFIPNVYLTGYTAGEIAIVTDQVQNGIIYYANSNGTAQVYPLDQFCVSLINQLQNQNG